MHIAKLKLNTLKQILAVARLYQSCHVIISQSRSTYIVLSTRHIHISAILES
jgi:hypothetical protein